MTDNSDEERVGMSVEGGGQEFWGMHTKRVNAPVHEQMTISALINSEALKNHDNKLDRSLTFIWLRDNPTARPDLNDFIRGVIWNDDPQCLLFNDKADQNLSYGIGLDWGNEYAAGKLMGGGDKSDLIRRSHFGDLQWLHAMSSVKGEPAIETKTKVLRWMETVYKLATGAMDPDTPIQSSPMRDWFDDPAHYNTFGELLTYKHKAPANIKHRALGSCFHVLQDSYAIGHTRREPLNAGDRIPADGIKYKPGVVDRWGAILNFHTYGGQGEDHGHYDHSSDGRVENMNLTDLESWNDLVGCRDGLDACIVLANYWTRKAPWDEVSQWLDTKVFELSKDVTSGDNTVA
jgi:hypothetical protein